VLASPLAAKSTSARNQFLQERFAVATARTQPAS
jgi:hypothetical protein